MKNTFLKEYLQKIAETTAQSDAREESYYEYVKQLFQNYADAIGKSNIHITILPKKTEAGNPDFRIWDGKQHIIATLKPKFPMLTLISLKLQNNCSVIVRLFPI
jgi:hypothetical protein